MKHTVLIVDDEPTVLSSLKKVLELEGHEVLTASSGTAALEVLGREGPNLMLVDLRMPGLSGIETCTQARAMKPGLPVIVMTARSAPETAIAAMKCGAYDYVIKPFDVVALIALVDRALQAARREPPTAPIWSSEDGERLVRRSAAMLDVYKRIGQVASSDLGVLIRGDSGTGKELIARAIWTHSARASKPLVCVNCAALPEALLESELFGHEKGAFTSAISQRIGRFEQADGGTLFLDEIGDLTPGTQVKLLRVLQERTFERVGGSTNMKADVRIIAATHRNLEALLESGRFREDLYYRLKVATITVPSLRDHADDIGDLAEYFLRRGCAAQKRSGVAFSPEAMAILQAHNWPGNVRELEHCVSEAIVFCPGRWILPEHLRFGIAPPDAPGSAQAVNLLRDRAREILASNAGAAYHRFISEVERSIIAEALRTTGGNLVQASQLLGISRPTLRVKMRSYAIRVGETPVHTGE